MGRAMTDRQIDLEMAFSHQHHESYRCGDLYDAFRSCCRRRGHDGGHASGYGADRVWWGGAGGA